MYFLKQILKEIRWKLHQGKAKYLICTLIYLSNHSKYLDVLFLPLIYDCKEEEKFKSGLLKVNLAEN